MRKPSPISISSPRETSTSRPSASAASASMTAAALLLTTSAASAPVRRRRIAATWSCREPRPPGVEVVLEVRVAARRPRATRASAASGERRAAEVRVDDHAGRVEHAPQRGGPGRGELGQRALGQVARLVPRGDSSRARARTSGRRDDERRRLFGQALVRARARRPRAGRAASFVIQSTAPMGAQVRSPVAPAWREQLRQVGGRRCAPVWPCSCPRRQARRRRASGSGR